MDAPRKQKISRYPMNDKPSKNKAKNTGKLYSSIWKWDVEQINLNYIKIMVRSYLICTSGTVKTLGNTLVSRISVQGGILTKIK